MSALRLKCVWLAVALLLISGRSAPAYSVLAHEATIDLCWSDTIEPLLKRRFPGATESQLSDARAYAYGGSLIQDLGYYPFGNKFFSNLLHYVRSGDFVVALVRNASDINELAFAIGALAHYANDNAGHPEAVNRAVPMVFPKLRQKFGDTVTYVDAPAQHVIVEFSFDIVQAAAGAFPPDTYRRFIGFEVAQPLLARTFHEIYGLEMSEVFADEDRAIGTYRYAVSQIFPSLTRAAWKEKKDDIIKLLPDVEQSRFVMQYPRREFERDYGSDYQKPGWFARFLGVIYRIVPKVGPLKPLAFEAPTPEAEALFAKSFADATLRFKRTMGDLRRGQLSLANTDFDTGKPATHGEYALADDTYAELLEHWSDREFAAVPEAGRRNVLAFYGSDPRPVFKSDRKDWPDISSSLAALRAPVPKRVASAAR